MLATPNHNINYRDAENVKKLKVLSFLMIMVKNARLWSKSNLTLFLTAIF